MVKKRSIVLYIILSILTAGIWGLVWFVMLTNDTNKVCKSKKTAGGIASIFLIIITFGIYSFYWATKLDQNLMKVQAGQTLG